MNQTDFSLPKLIDTWIASQEPKEYKSWRASSIGGCPRAHYYKRLGVEPTNPPDERTQRVFQAGHIFHKFVQDIVLENTYEGIDESSREVELFDKELDLGGRFDLLVDFEGKSILYDIKTQHSRSFWHMASQAKDGKPISEQYPHHRMQLATYMTMLKRAGTPVDEGRILYVSKDDLATEEVSYLLTPELEKEVIDEVTNLNKHWKAKTLPDCTCEGWQIGYCQFADTDSEESVEVTAKSGRKYRKKQLTKCCSDKLFKE